MLTQSTSHIVRSRNPKTLTDHPTLPLLVLSATPPRLHFVTCGQHDAHELGAPKGLVPCSRVAYVSVETGNVPMLQGIPRHPRNEGLVLNGFEIFDATGQYI